METDYLSFILPEGILDFFEVTNLEKVDNAYHFSLSEKNIHPLEYNNEKLISKGFLDEITLRDFPLRGKACFLKLKRRKWLHVVTGKTVLRDWDLVAKGTRMTQEFALFLKGIPR